MKIVLQKFISQNTQYSRRQAEAMILHGEIKINGKIVSLSDRVEEEDLNVSLEINNKKIDLNKAKAKKIYLKLNKPKGYVCTTRRFEGEKNIFDLINLDEKLFSVGRLDKDSHGLLILTDDGALVQRLSHPKFGHEKKYQVTVAGWNIDSQAAVIKLLKGLDIGDGDGTVKAKQAEYLDKNIFLVTLTEGKKRQLRRMFKKIGLTVIDLERIEFAKVILGDLKAGQWKYLSPAEIEKLNKK